MDLRTPGLWPGFCAPLWSGFKPLLFHFPLSHHTPCSGLPLRFPLLSPSQALFFLVTISTPFLVHGSDTGLWETLVCNRH